jgi:hypothetical protein
MANRRFYQFQYALVPMVTDIFARISFGSTGAPTLDVANSKGIVSVVRNSAGNYTFVFGTKAGMLDPYNSLLNVKHIFDESGTSAAPASPGMYIVADNVSSPSLASLQVQFNAAGVATDPASGEIVKIQFRFKNSSVK